MRRWIVLAVIGFVALNCGPPETYKTPGMVKDTASGVIEPTHQTLDSRVSKLEKAVEALCKEDATESELSSAREAWKKLQKPLKQIIAWSFNMSPYRGMSFGIYMYKIDREPAYGDNIEGVIAKEETYRTDLRVDDNEKPDKIFPDGKDQKIDTEFIANQDYRRNAKGFPAVEYLLFGAKGDKSTLQMYKGEDEVTKRRCDYLEAATAQASNVTGKYLNAWSAEGEGFIETFRSETPDDEHWTTIQDSINAMVSQMVFVSKQWISKQLLGGPLGLHEDNAKIPDKVSSPHANASIAQIKSVFEGMKMLYQGSELSSEGRSLADFAKFRKKSVHKIVAKRIEEAEKAIEAIPAPLSEAVQNNRSKVEAAKEAVDELAKVIESDLKTSLGATTTKVVVDND